MVLIAMLLFWGSTAIGNSQAIAIPAGAVVHAGHVATLVGQTPPSVTLASVQVQMALGGSWRQTINTHVADGDVATWYRFDEYLQATTRDASGNGVTGTLSGGVATTRLGLPDTTYSLIPDDGIGCLFDGTTGTISATFPASTTTCTIEVWISPTSPSGAGTILINAANTVGLFLQASATNRRPDMAFSAALHQATVDLDNSVASHLVVSIAAGNGTFYINGVARGTFTGFPGFTPTQIGTSPGTTFPLKAVVGELVYYVGYAMDQPTAEAHYNTGLWTDISADLLSEPGLELSYGIHGNGPTDRIADAGQAELWLRNDAGNSGGLAGYYSPNHVNCRSGFTFGVMTRVLLSYNGTTYQRFIGKIDHIDPEPGRLGLRRTRVVLLDRMSDLIEADLRNVTLQLAKTETQLMDTLLDALPTTSQPLARHYDTAQDSIAYAFGDLGAGAKAIGPLGDLAISSLGFLFVDRYGHLRYENRLARQSSHSSFTFDNEMSQLAAPSSLDGVFNRVRMTVHPKRVDAAATTVLWSQAGASEAIAPSATLDIWGSYYKATDPEVAIGGTAQVAPVATTDYLANTAANGSGTNKTANVTVVAEAFSSSVKFSITNNDAGPVYITFLQIRGKGLYDEAPQTAEATSEQAYGDRPVAIDLRYQESLSVAQDLSAYLLNQYENQLLQVQSMAFFPQRREASILAALTLEVGDRITIVEDQTGLDVDVFVHRVQLRIESGRHMTCTLGLSSAVFFDALWIMDDADLSLAGTSTYFGFP